MINIFSAILNLAIAEIHLEINQFDKPVMELFRGSKLTILLLFSFALQKLCGAKVIINKMQKQI